LSLVFNFAIATLMSVYLYVCVLVCVWRANPKCENCANAAPTTKTTTTALRQRCKQRSCDKNKIKKQQQQHKNKKTKINETNV